MFPCTAIADANRNFLKTPEKAKLLFSPMEIKRADVSKYKGYEFRAPGIVEEMTWRIELKNKNNIMNEAWQQLRKRLSNSKYSVSKDKGGATMPSG